MIAFVDPAWKVVRAGEPSFFVWRIEKMQVRAVPRDHYGSFFSGDSYIVYNSSPIKGAGKLEMHIHFWLGSETTNDESTTAAIKTVELDEYLNGEPIQHREVQGFESARFKSYFKTGIRILNGGVESGLSHVTKDFKPRLFRVKGKRSPTMAQQASVAWDHFNSGDCFILETMSKVFVWVGKHANNMEKLQSIKVAMQLRDERAERLIVFVDDEKENELNNIDRTEWDSLLPLSSRTVQPAEPDTETDIKADAERALLKLYRCTDEEDGTCKIILEKEGILKQSDLESKDSFIIDNHIKGIWVWVGKRASPEERKKAMGNAHGFVVKKSYPAGTPVTRVIDGAEPTEFKMLFESWKEPRSITGLTRQNTMSRIAPTITTKFDAATLHSEPALAADTQLVDDGSGQLLVWRLKEKELEPVPEDKFGVFMDGDCYLIHYSYEAESATRHILYYWQGVYSAQDERGTIAWHTIQKDDELGGAAVQVRVIQGKEPPHLLTIFKGNMIVFNGGYSSSFEGQNGVDRGIPDEFLLQVRGGDKHNTRAIQVPLKASSLNSNDVFVLAATDKTVMWCGKGSTGDERERAKAIAGQWASRHELTVVCEGQEKDDFWNSFPEGKEPYASEESLKQPDLMTPARLFQCSNATGVIKAEEISDFAQSDLVPEDVMILDVGTAIFIWIGKGANKEERLSAGKLVYDYLQSDPRGRDMDTPIIQVQQGYEPPNFTGFFGPWNKDIWENNDFDTVRTQIEGVRILSPEEIYAPDQDLPKYPLEVLREQNPDKLPDDVDVLRKEMHLTDEDFVAAFGIEKEEFDELPQWRRTNLKKAAKLF